MAGYIGKSQGVTQVDGYTRSELDGGQLDTRYYTESEVDSLLSGIASDAITEGNSSVEVVDTGTGHVAVTVDGSETARFDANGRLGIGTSSVDSSLQVKDTSFNPVVSITSSTSGASILQMGDTSDLDAGKIQYTNSTDQLIFTANASEVGRFDSGGNLKFNSGFGSVATAYGCRAWVNFDSNNPSNPIRASGNVSSITDNGTGDHTVNFSTAMPDDDYAVSGAMNRNDGSNKDSFFAFALPATTSVRVFGNDAGGNLRDMFEVNVVIHR